MVVSGLFYVECDKFLVVDIRFLFAFVLFYFLPSQHLYPILKMTVLESSLGNDFFPIPSPGIWVELTTGGGHVAQS